MESVHFRADILMGNFVVGRRFTQKCRWKFSSPEAIFLNV
jgi:hypothetical protein